MNIPTIRHPRGPSVTFAVVCAVLLGAAQAPAVTTNIDLYSVADAFVFTGSGDPVNYYDAMDRNFGAMNSRQVAGSATAKGEFLSVIRFDAADAVASLDLLFGSGNWTVSSLALSLVVSQGASGGGIFNNGASGLFSVSWVSQDGDWLQGGGTRNLGTAVDHDTNGVNFTSGITWNGLSDILDDHPATLLSSFSYVTSGTLVPTAYDLGAGTSDLLDALAIGESISLLLAPAQDSVAFNFTSQSYGGAGSDAYDPRLTLTVEVVPEPATGGLVVAGVAGLLAWRRRLFQQ